MDIQAIGDDNYESRGGSCRVTSMREDYILRLVFEPQTGNKDCLNNNRHTLLRAYN